jgi:hypothetical protein
MKIQFKLRKENIPLRRNCLKKKFTSIFAVREDYCPYNTDKFLKCKHKIGAANAKSRQKD